MHWPLQSAKADGQADSQNERERGRKGEGDATTHRDEVREHSVLLVSTEAERERYVDALPKASH